MRDQAKAMLKIAAILDRLDPTIQREIIRTINHNYGGPLSAADWMVSLRTRRHTSDENIVTPMTKPAAEMFRTNPGNVPDKGNPPDPPAKALASRTNHLRTEALEVLNFLNLKANKSFRAIDTNLRPITARLSSGVSVQDCKGVIARQIREWKDTELEKYLRPKTLFNATNFESYLGQKPGETRPEIDQDSASEPTPLTDADHAEIQQHIKGVVQHLADKEVIP